VPCKEPDESRCCAVAPTCLGPEMEMHCAHNQTCHAICEAQCAGDSLFGPGQCKRWFDGCNTCSCTGGHQECTENVCLQQEEPFCMEAGPNYVQPENGDTCQSGDVFLPLSSEDDCGRVLSSAPCECISMSVPGSSKAFVWSCAMYRKQRAMLPCMCDGDSFSDPGPCVWKVDGLAPDGSSNDVTSCECAVWDNGCNECTCSSDGVEICTERVCKTTTEPKCLRWVNSTTVAPITIVSNDCCDAKTAKCKACNAGQTEAKFCRKNPGDNACRKCDSFNCKKKKGVKHNNDARHMVCEKDGKNKCTGKQCCKKAYCSSFKCKGASQLVEGASDMKCDRKGKSKCTKKQCCKEAPQ